MEMELGGIKISGWMDIWMEQREMKEAREERKSLCSPIVLEMYF